MAGHRAPRNHDEPEDPQRTADIALELRRLSGLLARPDLAPEVVASAAEELRALGDRLVPEAGAPSPTAWAIRVGEQAAGGPPSTAEESQVHHPLYAGTSGVFPPITLTVDLPHISAETTFGEAFEGPPGLVHGGFVAAGFDMVLSALALRMVEHSVTRWLKIRYLGPVFLHQVVRYEVEAGEPHGRLLTLKGRLHTEDRVAVRAEAQFVAMDLQRFADRGSTM
jgi:acyl-coenzyme A thioesterase PaaI-like protein